LFAELKYLFRQRLRVFSGSGFYELDLAVIFSERGFLSRHPQAIRLSGYLSRETEL
jgi:hypothetical protein